MKKTRRIAAMVAAMALAACSISPVMMNANAAAEVNTISFTGETAGTHVYTAYRIFNGTASENGFGSKVSLGNPTWAGTEGKLTDFISALKTENVLKTGETYDFANATTVDDIIEVLSGYDTNSAKAKAFAKVAAAGASDYGFQSATKANGAETNSITANTDGYYVISETTFTPDTSHEGNEGAMTAYLLGVYDASVGAEIAVKTSVPSVVKKVQDINDTTETQLSNLQDSADYDIGDVIPYTITATIGEDIANFDAYSIQFVDDMSKGLTLSTTGWKVEVVNADNTTTDITSLFTAPTSADSTANTNGKVWTWAARDVKTYTKNDTLTALVTGDKIVLTYDVTLNENAVIGSTGNPNTVSLKYDNNPNSCGTGNPAGETPKDKNIVFTYKTVFNKFDEKNAPLSGADFKLEKKVNGIWVDVTQLHTGEGAINPTKNITNSTSFEFAGLDDGDYKLTETTTPNGYNTIDPITFTITAGHVEIDDNPTLQNLTGADGTEFTMTANVEAGSLTASIKNEQGSTLPSTGGIGTTLFYLGGGITVALAGIYLVSKKRAGNAE